MNKPINAACAALLALTAIAGAGCQALSSVTNAKPNFASPSQILSAFSGKGYTCDGPAQSGQQWVTTCQQTVADPKGELSASGPDNHSVDLVTTDFVGVYQSPTKAEVMQVFDAVVQAACQGGSASQVQSWVHANLSKQSADATTAGYHVHLTQNGVGYYLTINSQ